MSATRIPPNSETVNPTKPEVLPQGGDVPPPRKANLMQQTATLPHMGSIRLLGRGHVVHLLVQRLAADFVCPSHACAETSWSLAPGAREPPPARSRGPACTLCAPRLPLLVHQQALGPHLVRSARHLGIKWAAASRSKTCPDFTDSARCEGQQHGGGERAGAVGRGRSRVWGDAATLESYAC